MRTSIKTQKQKNRVAVHTLLSTDDVFDAIRKGDERVLTQVYEEYRNPFFRWIKHQYSICEEVSQEIYQKAFIIFYENVKSGKLTTLKSSIRTYIFGIGKHLVRDHWRECKKAFDTLEELPESCHGLDMKTEEEELAEFHQSWMANMIGILPEKAQKILTLYYYNNYSMEAIAYEMGYKNEKVAKKVRRKLRWKR